MESHCLRWLKKEAVLLTKMKIGAFPPNSFVIKNFKHKKIESIVQKIPVYLTYFEYSAIFVLYVSTHTVH